MTPDSLHQRRAARLQARRAADELLIEAIFGDSQVAHLARPPETTEPPVLSATAEATLR